MKPDTLDRFRKREFKPGDALSFYIGEVTKDNRIILTEESPEEKKQKIQTFIETSKGITLKANIAAIMNFGVIVNIGDITGIIPSREFRLRKISTRNFVSGDEIKVKFLESKDDKITFELDSPIKKYENKEKEEGA